MDFSALDHGALAAAVGRLEEPSFAGRLAALAGKPVGLVQRALPIAATTAVANATKRALDRALEVALFSLKNPTLNGGRKLHSGLACASGAVGGAFGLPALAVDSSCRFRRQSCCGELPQSRSEERRVGKEC